MTLYYYIVIITLPHMYAETVKTMQLKYRGT